MTRALSILFLLLPLFSWAQTSEMRVYTVAGNDTATGTNYGDGGPATLGKIEATEGIWMDGKCNLYISANNIRKVNTQTGIITTIAGTTGGFSGDGGPATDAQIKPYGIYVDFDGNVYIADNGNNRVRRVDGVSGIITTFAGGGSVVGDNGPATNAALDGPANVYGDNAGNIYIGERARLRKVNSLGIITTIAGTGVGLGGYSGDGGLATNAQVSTVSGMLMDNNGVLYFADRGNSIIRKIDTKGVITTVAGTAGVFDYGGDGGPATAAKLSGPISFVIDIYGNLVIGDNQNDRVRKVDAKTGIITTIAGTGDGISSYANGALATTTSIHPEFMYLDAQGNIYYSCFCNQVRVITNYNRGLNGRNTCGILDVPGPPLLTDDVTVFPNPANDVLIVKTNVFSSFNIRNIFGQVMLSGNIDIGKQTIDISRLSQGLYYLYLANGKMIKYQKIIKL